MANPTDITEAEKLRQLDTMVLTDMLPEGVRFDTIYLYSETADNQRSVLEQGVVLHKKHAAPVAIVDDWAREWNRGHPGAMRWGIRLAACGVRSVCVVPCNAPLNTLTESLALAAYAKEHKWNRIVIVAPPFHQTRCFVSMVTAAMHMRRPHLRIYNAVGTHLNWRRSARHSQGKDRMKRFLFPVTEARRIFAYQDPAKSVPISLLPTDEVIRYLLWRGQK